MTFDLMTILIYGDIYGKLLNAKLFILRKFYVLLIITF